MNEKAKAEVFLHRLAFEKHYAIHPNDELEFIGLDEELNPNKQIILTSDRFFINSGIQAFSNIVQKEPRSKSNSGLLKEYKGQTIDDIFAHEQNLVVEEDGETLLVQASFGESHIEEIAEKHNLKILAKLPIDPKISAACDKGMIELFDGNWLEPVTKILESMEDN